MYAMRSSFCSVPPLMGQYQTSDLNNWGEDFDTSLLWPMSHRVSTIYSRKRVQIQIGQNMVVGLQIEVNARFDLT